MYPSTQIQMIVLLALKFLPPKSCRVICIAVSNLTLSDTTHLLLLVSTDKDSVTKFLYLYRDVLPRKTFHSSAKTGCMQQKVLGNQCYFCTGAGVGEGAGACVGAG